MTDPAVPHMVDPAPAPNSETSHPITPSPGPAPTETPNPNPPNADVPAFQVKAGYEDRGWAKNLKSDDDVWKALDNAQKLIGQKTIVNAPGPDATQEEKDAFYGALGPKDVTEYQFPEDVTDQEKALYGTILKDSNISVAQATKLMPAFMQAMEGVKEGMYGKDDFVSRMKESFGDGYENQIKGARDILSTVLSDDDKKLLDEKVPNEALAVVYRLAAKVKEQYGVTETGTNGEKPAGTMGTGDLDAQAAKLREEILTISNRPHTQEEKQRKIDELHNIYTLKGKTK